MSPDLFTAKTKASLIHLSLSTVVLGLSLVIAISLWYPGLWFQLDGGWQGIRIMALVDLVLGPLLTFVIFNPAKSRRHLTIDISCIATLQIAALIWGIQLIHQQRPLAIVYSDKAFYSVDQASLEKAGRTLLDLHKVSKQQPAMIFCAPPESPADAIQRLLDELNRAIAHYEQIDCYRPLQDNTEAVFQNSLDVSQSAELQSELKAFLKKHPGKTVQNFAFVPFYGRYGESLLIMDEHAHIIDRLNSTPSD